MKAHLKNSDVPLIAGQDQKAICGEIVPKASFPCSWTAAEGIFQPKSSILFCRKCFFSPLEGKYVYALAPGQEEMVPE